MWMVNVILFFITFSVFLRYLIFPLLLSRLTRFRVNAFSLFSIRGLEYRCDADHASPVPTLRVERMGWMWGGMSSDGSVGLIVLKIETVSLRLKKHIKNGGHEKSTPPTPPPTRFSVLKGRILSSILHLVIHHYPTIARVISVQLSDVRFIFDDLNGLELTIKDIRAGAKIDFEGNNASSDPLPPDAPTPSSPVSTCEEYARGNPFASPLDGPSPFGSPQFAGLGSTVTSPLASPLSSPPGSPLAQDSPLPWANSSFAAFKPEIRPTRMSRMAHARRRASHLQTRMASTAASVWARAIARAHGSVTITIAVKDIALILPHVSGTRDDMPGGATGVETKVDAQQVKHRPSVKSFSTNLRARSLTSVGSFHSLFLPKSTPLKPIPRDGFERLLVIEGDSRASLCLGFGPKKGLLGEDTLSSKLELGRIVSHVEAAERLLALTKDSRKSLPRQTTKASNKWSPRSMPRIILRAFQSVSFSLLHVSIKHHLPVPSSSPVSARSSVTDMSELLSPESDGFTLSFDISRLSCKLSAADSSNDPIARNAFGSNTSPESRVRGVNFALQWNTIGLQCLAPGEKSHEMSQLVQMRTAEIEGLSTWRPQGWSREELLFACDPNLSLAISKGDLDSLDISADVQLLTELKEAWKRAHPSQASKPSESTMNKHIPLPPRLRINFSVGQTMIVLADGESERKTTLSLASDAFQLTCFTSFSDIVARRRDKAATKSALKREDDLRQRRDSAGDTIDYAQPEAMLKPELRRHFDRNDAVLKDGYAISMRFDTSCVVEPTSIHMTLSGSADRDQRSYELASIGRVHGTCCGDVLGRQRVLPDGTEVAGLDPESISCLLDLGIDKGIRVNLYSMPVIEALIGMVRAHQPSNKNATKAQRSDLLCRLPSGVSARVSIGLISIFVGHEDPNPKCDLKLTRGLWIQTTFTWEYAYFARRSQCLRGRHTHTAPTRSKLRLPEDITTQAVAFENLLGPREGGAALVSMALHDTFIKPIFNGQRFADAGGTRLSHQPVVPPAGKDGEAYVGWDFRRPQPPTSINKGRFANNIDPLDVEDTDQASRPLLQIRRAAFNWNMIRPAGGAELQHKITSKIEHVDVVGDLSHVYCCLLAATTLVRIANAAHRQQAPTGPRRKLDISLEMVVPSVRAHFAFPLREHLFIYLGNCTIHKPATAEVKVSCKKILAFVPNPRQVGKWDELARVKSLEVRATAPGQPKAFDINAEAMRIRIPVSYQLSRLVLNINVTIKAIKLLLHDLGSARFETTKKPGAEEPKKVPKLRFHFEHLTLEAKDDPIETNLNLIWRAGMAEQEKRNELRDQFDVKLRLVNERLTREAGGVVADPISPPPNSKLTDKATVSDEEALERLYWHFSRTWVRRIRLAKQEQRRREQEAQRHVEDAGLSNEKLPITISEQTLTAPLFRLALQGVNIGVEDLGWKRQDIIDYMGGLSSKFDKDAQFSLMVPLKLSWSMRSGTMTLRDYPLPLIRLPSRSDGNGPAWEVETPFIIAEELQGDDSLILVPTEVIPEGCGHFAAKSFTVEIAKTIMPVKTYTRPVVQVSTDRTTEFTWGNSYQPAIQDFMKVVETLSHPPRDPSPRVGFWDKFRLILHWKVTVNFKDNVHMHLKGSYDPYLVVGYGAGFALSWKGGTKLEINQPNEQHETIQITASELLIAIPDLTALNDTAAMGNEIQPQSQRREDDPVAEQALIERRYTKPCARFLNGVRVGFGFVLERTCRPWTCKENCGGTENNFHRQCRFFTFKKHQEVILRSPAAIEREEAEVGRAVDSYEGFRSDYIHFSVSVVAPINRVDSNARDDAENQNSLHMSPKASAHFFAWWKLFNHTMSLPIRQGRLFPHSPPPSKKFGRSLGTIKYRCDLAPVYVSHMYAQGFKDMWSAGKSQSLGIKARFDRFRADAHQRAQEQTVRNEVLKRTQQVIHKPFYAADLILNGIQLKGIRADFVETARPYDSVYPGHPDTKVSALPEERRAWYNLFDFIDADRKPFDKDPEVQIIDLMDCPQVFFSKRNKVRPTTPQDDDANPTPAQVDARFEMESSKFGHEKSHICYLGAASGVAETQSKIVRQRISQLEERRAANQRNASFDHKANNARLMTLYRHLEHLAKQEHRHIDDDTFQADTRHPAETSLNASGEIAFENTFHVHCPRVYYNNTSRNILFKYFFSNRDRKREEYMTSHASLRSVQEGIERRIQRSEDGYNQQDRSTDAEQNHEHAATQLLTDLQNILGDKAATRLFRTPNDHTTNHENLDIPSRGLPKECAVKARWRVLVLKPQIALRSEATEDSIILLAVEEISFKGFSVRDHSAKDHISGDVMGRYYVAMKGLQAFYPTSEALQRERECLPNQRALDFIPLEIFLDVRSEATDYDRIVLKTDFAISMDRFNHLRMARGLQWPRARDEWGQEIKHLRIHQDLTTILVPRLQVSATSKHYNALYNVVTDLLLYQDPGHRDRADRIDSFTFAFDRKDRDPSQLLVDLSGLQKNVRSLLSVQAGYEANVDLLTEEGKNELFRIRTDLLEATEQLFTVFEAISVSQSRDDARAALKSASRLDVRIGGLAWVMLRDNMAPLLKLDVEGTLFSQVSNKDGSKDTAVTCYDLTALNSDSEAVYPEVLVRYDTSNHKKRTKETFLSACWSILAPVGGISIIRHFGLYLLPVRFRLEEKVGHQVTDYIFSDRVERRKEKNAKREGEKDKKNGSIHSLGMTQLDASSTTLANRSNGSVPLSRSKSQVSVLTVSTVDRHEDTSKPDEKFTMVPMKDATEMRKRASANSTFVNIVFGATSFILSYKSDESRKHNSVVSFKMPDCVDFKIKTPEMIYNNKVWGYEDIFEHVKRDIRSYVWSQTGHILGQLFKKTSIFRTKNALRSLALSSEMLPRSKLNSPTSPSSLRYTVEPPTPSNDEASNALALARAITAEREREHTSPLSRTKSRISDGGPQVLGVPLTSDPSPMSGSDREDEEEGEEDEGRSGMGKKMKGIIGRIKKHTSKFDLSHGTNSNEELARRVSVDRPGRRSVSNSPGNFYVGEQMG